MNEQIENLERFGKDALPYAWLVPSILIGWTVLLIIQVLGKVFVVHLFGTAAGESARLALGAGTSPQIAAATFASAASQVAAGYYSAVASATGSILGFLVTAATIFLTTSQEKLFFEFLKEGKLTGLFRAYMRAIWATAGTLLLSLVAMFTKRGDVASFWLEYVLQMLTLISLSLALAFLAQCVRILADAGINMLQNIDVAGLRQQQDRLDDIEKRTGPPGAV